MSSEEPESKKAKLDEAKVLKNDGGLEYVRLESDNGSSAEVYLLGGVVTSYKDSEGTEFVGLRADAKFDGSKANISGGLQHCWPQFGPGKILQHGFARNATWTVSSVTKTETKLELKPNDYTKPIWDEPFALTFTVELSDDELKTTTAVINTASDGDSSFDFQAALHSYWKISSLKNLKICGSFQGREFLNRVAGETQKEERSEITIEEEYDRLFSGVKESVLKDSGTKKSLTLINESGYEDTLLWNPYGNEKMGYDNFVCVESVKYDPVTLKAGESWNGVLVMKPGKI